MTTVIGKKRYYSRFDFECESGNVRPELAKRKREIEQRLFLDLFSEQTRSIKNRSRVYEMANAIISKPLECYSKSIEFSNKYAVPIMLTESILPFKVNPLVRVASTVACLAKETYDNYFK